MMSAARSATLFMPVETDCMVSAMAGAATASDVAASATAAFATTSALRGPKMAPRPQLPAAREQGARSERGANTGSAPLAAGVKARSEARAPLSCIVTQVLTPRRLAMRLSRLAGGKG